MSIYQYVTECRCIYKSVFLFPFLLCCQIWGDDGRLSFYFYFYMFFPVVDSGLLKNMNLHVILFKVGHKKKRQ